MITKEEMDNIAMLAKLRISQEEYSALNKDLQRMVGFVNVIKEADTKEVESDFMSSFDCAFGTDEVKASLPREQILENAPLCDEESFVVRKRA